MIFLCLPFSSPEISLSQKDAHLYRITVWSAWFAHNYSYRYSLSHIGSVHWCSKPIGRKGLWLAVFGIIVKVTGQFTDKPTRCQSSSKMANSRTW